MQPGKIERPYKMCTAIQVPETPDLRTKYDTTDEVEEDYDYQKRFRIVNQVIIFTFSYLLWCMVHVEREFWSMSKKSIDHLKIDGLNKSFFGTLDSVQFFAYALTEIFLGSIGDNFG